METDEGVDVRIKRKTKWEETGNRQGWFDLDCIQVIKIDKCEGTVWLLILRAELRNDMRMKR